MKSPFYNHKHHLLAFLVLPLLILTGCTKHYCGNDFLMPGVEAKGQTRISAGYNTMPELNSSAGRPQNYNAQLLHSPWDNLAFGAGFYSRKRAEFSSVAFGNNLENSTLSEFSLALGTYKEVSKGLLLDVYLGGSIGQIKHKVSDEASVKLNYRKTFLHLGTHHWDMEKFRFGIGLKIVNVNFTNAAIEDYVSSFWFDEIRRLQNDDPFLFVEPTYRIEMGLDAVRLNMSLTMSTFHPEDIDLSPQVGLTFDLHKLRNRNRDSKGNIE